MVTNPSKDSDWSSFPAPMNPDATLLKHNDEARLSCSDNIASWITLCGRRFPPWLFMSSFRNSIMRMGHEQKASGKGVRHPSEVPWTAISVFILDSSCTQYFHMPNTFIFLDQLACKAWFEHSVCDTQHYCNISNPYWIPFWSVINGHWAVQQYHMLQNQKAKTKSGITRETREYHTISRGCNGMSGVTIFCGKKETSFILAVGVIIQSSYWYFTCFTLFVFRVYVLGSIIL